MCYFCRLSSAALFLLVVFCLSLCVSVAESRSTVTQTPLDVLIMSERDQQLNAPLRRLVKRSDDAACEAKKAAFPVLVQVLEQVCLLCNELYSHEEINVRARCRANCFRNDMIGKCMTRFAPRDALSTFEF